MKTFPCFVNNHVGFYGSIITIKSPWTGRQVTLREAGFKYCPAVITKVQSITPVDGGTGICDLTKADLINFRDAAECARDDYKESLNRDGDDEYDAEQCEASEVNDGECPHCEAKVLARSRVPGVYHFGSNPGGL